MANIPGVWVHIPGSLGTTPTRPEPWAKFPLRALAGTSQKQLWGKVGWLSLSAGNARCGVLHSLCWGTNTGTGPGRCASAPQCLELGQAISPTRLPVISTVVSYRLQLCLWGKSGHDHPSAKSTAQSTHQDNPAASMQGRDYKIGWNKGSPSPFS